MEIKISKSILGSPKRRPSDSELGFGKYMTDHMFIMDYEDNIGWHNARIHRYQDLKIDPAALVLHYGQQVFEGMKAFALLDGGIGLFRVDSYFQRLNKSAKRMAMPEIDVRILFQAVKELILLDLDWLPKTEGTALYIRPAMIATEASLGVKLSRKYIFFIILNPVGFYYADGFNPIKILVSDTYIRAARGGAGNIKTSCNYGPTLLTLKNAKELGYSQVLWLDAIENRYIEEIGTSNIFFLIGEEFVTPPLGGTILPGITRDSVIQLLKHWGYIINERFISIEELIDAYNKNILKEIFGTGTAAVISPVGEICYKDITLSINDGKIGKFTKTIYDEITYIQYGKKEDVFNWITRIK